MTYEELIEQTRRFQQQALRIVDAQGDPSASEQRAVKLADDLGEFAEAIDHCRIAAA